MLGRPGMPLPVFTNSWAGAWLNRSVCTERTIAMSSTTFARCGNTSEISAPHCAMSGELEPRSQDGGIGLNEGVPLALDDFGRNRLAFQLRQLRLVVEQFELTRRARHEQIDDAFGRRRKMRRLGSRRVRARRRQPPAISPASNDARAILPTPTPQS